jgi:dihydroorotate dehydrogenase
MWYTPALFIDKKGGVMKLRGIEFGNVLGASGVQGFFGEGYWFHKPWHLLGLDFSNMTFVAKTATLQPRAGNMPLTRRLTPRDWFPACVKARPLRGVMLNSVGLSNPGLLGLLSFGHWQKRTEPFWISVMPMAKTPEERLEEMHHIVQMLNAHKIYFRAPFGLQINLSCPNTGQHSIYDMFGESWNILDVAGKLGVPVMPKYSIASAHVPAVKELEKHPVCDAICVSNTIPFGWKSINWERTWGSRVSPLGKLGGGGLSGAALLPHVCDWIERLRYAGFTKPINGGGGIMTPDDVNRYHEAGASSVFVGSVAALRPWRVKRIINRANALHWR